MPIPIKRLVTPTIIATPYTANTVVGGLQTLSDISAQGVIRDVLLLIDGTITPALDLYFFDAAPAAIADNATFAPSYADQVKMLTADKISVVSGDYQTLNSKTRAHKVAVNKDFVAAGIGNSGYSLYLFIVSPGTPTFPSTSALTVKITLWDGKR